jgi:Mannosylglycerate hydrolase MGH1-like glycoside hydrolase domain/Glycosyl hydrolase family 63 C-terminal domain
MNAELSRIEEKAGDEQPWRLWGPYVSGRQWGTVREDYSADGDAWSYFPHDHARSRAYRWGEDGLAGISDAKQRLCFAWAFWNGHDPILKERFFGLGGHEGNHGEDVKEIYWYLDNTPSHSYMRMLYRYPQTRFPYEELTKKNIGRSKLDREFELWDTGILANNRFFDIEITYAKVATEDILIHARILNRGPNLATLTALPTLWFRNTWSWGRDDRRPNLRIGVVNDSGVLAVEASHHVLGEYQLHCQGAAELLFTENETNMERLFGVPNSAPYVKDAFHEYVIHGNRSVQPDRNGTKAAALYQFQIPGGSAREIRLRLRKTPTNRINASFDRFDETITLRRREADEFYQALAPACLSKEQRAIQRQAFAGLLWNKQFYYYIVEEWLDGDPAQPPPPELRKLGRNSDWRNLYNERVMSMPDNWEYPWYASWDLAFHCIPMALIDCRFAKRQLERVVREWYQHPNGDVPAYEWNFGDANPPVLAWATWRVYKIEEKESGQGDRPFLETIFHKLLLNFTWWVNRKDSGGRNIFQGGFLGLDNIGVFDRSASLPGGGHLEQSDATSWMGMFCLNLMRIALELARKNPVYENIAIKFFEHFLGIAAAMNNMGGDGIGLWDETDEFFYDMLHLPDGRHFPLRVRSLVGLLPLIAVETIEPELLDAMPEFRKRLEWILTNKPELAGLISRWQEPGSGERRLIALTRGHRMKRLLRRMLEPNEFLSDYGIRSMSKYHQENHYVLECHGPAYVVTYERAESQTGLFGGNSNWRGPIWFPINYLLIESLQKFHHYYGDDFKVECPAGSGRYATLKQIANELSNRLIKLFLRDPQGERPCLRGSLGAFNATDAERIWFHEYFDGDNGAGLGASHQTGWTALVAKLIQQQGSFGTIEKLDAFSDL